MKRLAYLLLSGAALSIAPGCSKDDSPTSSGLKDYQVEYRVSATAPSADYVSYTNESGGKTTLGLTALPATYSFQRAMKRGDNLTILASLAGGTAASEITCAILLDGREVKKATGRGVAAQAGPVYIIGE